MFQVQRDSGLTGGVGSGETTDAERRISDLVRVGRVVEVSYGNPASPRVRVGIGDPDDADGYIKTGWLPIKGDRAGNGDGEWNPPEVGESVEVISEGGEIQNGVVQRGAIYSEDNPAPGDRVGLWRKRFKDGSVIEYDRDSRAMLLDAQSAGSLTLRAGGCEITMIDGKLTLSVGGVSHEISAAGLKTTGGEITHDGKSIGKTHTHLGVQTGGGVSGQPS